MKNSLIEEQKTRPPQLEPGHKFNLCLNKHSFALKRIQIISISPPKPKKTCIPITYDTQFS